MSAPSCYTSENIATAGATPNRNGAPEALANFLPADLIEWHCSYAEAQRRARKVSLACRRCDQPFEIIQRGIRLTKWPTICPECKRQAKAAYATQWRAWRRAERQAAQAARCCAGCGASIREGRFNRCWCSSACRQAESSSGSIGADAPARRRYRAAIVEIADPQVKAALDRELLITAHLLEPEEVVP